MSDHPKEADRNLKRIYICDDIYFDVFHLLARAKVGLELALVSDRFDALVDTHFKSRKWALGKLKINQLNIVKMNDSKSKTILPIPQKPLLNSIVGFSSVNIYTTNSIVVNILFLRLIGRLLESNVCLYLSLGGEANWNIFATSVWPLLNASGIIKIHFGFRSDFQQFRHFISPSILRDCTNLRMITCDNDNVLQFPPNESEGSSDGQAMCKWLHEPRADGRPKVLKCRRGGDVQMDALKTSFSNATTSVSFIIHLYPNTIGPFELFNSLTREQLTNRRIGNNYYWWRIERSPIDKSAEQWAEWEKEALDDGTNKLCVS